METPHHGPDRQEPDQPRRPNADAVLIEGRFRSIEDKVQWMLAGRERLDPDEPADPDEPPLAELSDRDISVYVATSVRDRPWLSILTADHPPETWRAVVALDKSESHTLERHSAYGDSTSHERRVTHLEDPAQTDPKLRAHGIDGISGKGHYCADTQTRFTTVEAMATAYVNGKQDPRVVAALETPVSTAVRPADVVVPIADLLGPDGHEHCAGFQLDGDVGDAKRARRAWERERRDWIAEHGDTTGFTAEPPTASPIHSFDGGEIVFRFGRNSNGDGHVITSHYPQPQVDRDEV